MYEINQLGIIYLSAVTRMLSFLSSVLCRSIMNNRNYQNTNIVPNQNTSLPCIKSLKNLHNNIFLKKKSFREM